MNTLTEKYRKICAAHGWTEDPDQVRAFDRLYSLHKQLKKPAAPQSWAARIFGMDKKNEQTACQGVYMYGGVGRGKTFVMDLFYDFTDTPQKKRQHFNEFMLDIHTRLHKRRQSGSTRRIDADLLTVAEDIAAETRLLCFDELFVEDVADAMLLGRLFRALFDAGVHVVMTSNISPDDLYEKGLQRERFLPFITLLHRKMEIIAFEGQKDYRGDALRDQKKYIWPDDATARADMKALFDRLTDNADPTACVLPVRGREITLPVTANDVAMSDFDTLCGAALGAEDYLALAKAFPVLLITGVPQLNDEKRNETRRFMTLIDMLYEKEIRLFLSAAVPVSDLYTGKQYQQAFERTRSRLIEMQSPDYP
ncbi:MAG: cell division protein ZapE [Pseudomonadota bacterium]